MNIINGRSINWIKINDKFNFCNFIKIKCKLQQLPNIHLMLKNISRQ